MSDELELSAPTPVGPECIAGHANPPGNRFCGQCGEKLERVCVNGHPAAPGLRFCGECGASLASSLPPPPAPINTGEGPVEVVLQRFEVKHQADAYGYVDSLIVLHLLFTNRSGKAVRAFSGGLTITDLFGSVKLSAGLTVDNPTLQPGAAHQTSDWSVKFNEYIDEHLWLANRAITDVEWVFRHDAAIFTDGTRWTA